MRLNETLDGYNGEIMLEYLVILAIFLDICLLGNYLYKLDKTIKHYRKLNDDDKRKV